MTYKTALSLTTLALTVGFLLAAGPAHATDTPVADAAFPTNNSNEYSALDSDLPALFQTFTPGITGLLAQVDLELSHADPLAIDALIYVFATNSQGVPIDLEHPLATARQGTQDIGGQATITSFVFDEPAQLVAGRHYAISVTLDTHGQPNRNQLRWHQRGIPTSYSGGSQCYWNTSTPISNPTISCWDDGGDLGFATFVTPHAAPPEPSAPSTPKLAQTGMSSTGALGMGALAAGIGLALLMIRRKETR